MTEENRKKIENVMNLYLSWNLGDIRKAAHMLPYTFDDMDQTTIQKIYPTYDGGAMIGAAILAMCAISSISQFCITDNKNEGKYIWFIDNYLKKINSLYDGREIYSLRCSLIKNYALLADVGGKNITRYSVDYAITNGGEHLFPTKHGKTLNIRQFMVDIQLATQKLFFDVLLSDGNNEISNNIIKYHDQKKIGPIK